MENLELTQLTEMLTDKETAKKLSEGVTAPELIKDMPPLLGIKS